MTTTIINGTVIGETEKALKVSVNCYCGSKTKDFTFFLPKAQVKPFAANGGNWIELPQWLADSKSNEAGKYKYAIAMHTMATIANL